MFVFDRVLRVLGLAILATLVTGSNLFAAPRVPRCSCITNADGSEVLVKAKTGMGHYLQTVRQQSRCQSTPEPTP